MKYAMMTTEVMEKMANCFASPEDLLFFCKAFHDLSTEIVFLNKLVDHLPEYSEPAIRLKCIAMITIFFRENVEVMRELIKVCEVKSLSEEQVIKMSEKLRKRLLDLDEENESEVS